MSDDELPGMWSRSDFEGGKEDGVKIPPQCGPVRAATCSLAKWSRVTAHDRAFGSRTFMGCTEGNCELRDAPDRRDDAGRRDGDRR